MKMMIIIMEIIEIIEKGIEKGIEIIIIEVEKKKGIKKNKKEKD